MHRTLITEHCNLLGDAFYSNQIDPSHFSSECLHNVYTVCELTEAEG